MEQLYSSRDIEDYFNIPHRKLIYLFESRKLRTEDFDVLAGRRIYRKDDFLKIGKAIRSVRPMKT